MSIKSRHLAVLRAGQSVYRITGTTSGRIYGGDSALRMTSRTAVEVRQMGHAEVILQRHIAERYARMFEAEVTKALLSHLDKP